MRLLDWPERLLRGAGRGVCNAAMSVSAQQRTPLRWAVEGVGGWLGVEV